MPWFSRLTDGLLPWRARAVLRSSPAPVLLVFAVLILTAAAVPEPAQAGGFPATASVISPNSDSQRTAIRDDVDCDGDIDPVDALSILRWIEYLPVYQNEPCPDIGTELH